jgi:7-keto-8-aminopelargonate synthetase-like enzyme
LVDTADVSVAAAGDAGLIFEQAEGAAYDGRHLQLHETTVLNFGGCSYLGLDQRQELKDGVIDAVQRYGSQFSFSRAYIDSPLNHEIECLLAQMTGGHALVTGSTTLAHVAALPAVIRPHDAVLIDHFAHASLHTATALLRGIHVKVLRHNRLEELEREVAALSQTHNRVWFLLDGVYSMFGDLAPMDHLSELLAKYPRLQLYVDDAHATSWRGKNGRGHTLDAIPDRSRVVVALSLNKGFAAGGGALIFGSSEDRDRVRRSGPMIFGGPVQPPMLGAAVASAKLHLAPDFAKLQQQLLDRIRLVVALAEELRVPLASVDATPIFFIVCHDVEVTYAVARAMRSRGIYVSISVYPAVPRDKCGIRFTITLHNAEDDIRFLMHSLSVELAGRGLAGPPGVEAKSEAQPRRERREAARSGSRPKQGE